MINILALSDTLWGVIIGGSITLIAGYLAHRSNINRFKLQCEHEEKAKLKESLGQKLEDMQTLLNRLKADMLMNLYNIRASMRGEITYSEALQINITSRETTKSDFERLRMLVLHYFSDLEPDLENYNKTTNDALAIVNSYNNNQHAAPTFIPLIEAKVDEISEISSCISKKIAEKAHLLYLPS